MRSGPEGAISRRETALIRHAETILTSSPPVSTKSGGTQ